MTTSKARIMFLASQEDAEVLRETSALTGRSISALVGEYMEQVVPTLRNVNAALKAAQGMEEALRARLVQGLEAAEADLSAEALEIQRRMEAQLAQVAAAVPEKPALRAVPKPPPPRPVIRGSSGGAPVTPPLQKRG